ncbi:MAG: hypothetical protein FJ102_14870 [Deltaproteobacteria bacterium]|nr:hypothetical protein [Deltaproteobacteria bacterium]
MSQPDQPRSTLVTAFNELPAPVQVVAAMFGLKLAAVVLFMVMWLCGAMVLVSPWLMLFVMGIIQELGR